MADQNENIRFVGELEERTNSEKARWGARGRKYGMYLFAIALAGWALSSYDYNLLTTTFPAIATALHLSSTDVGLLGTLVSVVSIFVPIGFGYMMDLKGRRIAWMIALLVTALATGFTALVQNFVELAIVRMVASSFGLAELGISITIVNETVGPNERGWLYSWVQGGWPLGVFLASAVYLGFIHFGFRVVFLVGIVPIIVVVIGRYYIKDPERFETLKKVRELMKKNAKKDEILQAEEYRNDIDQVNRSTFLQLFATPGYVRNQLVKVMVVWFFYASSWMLTNVFIIYYLVTFYGWNTTYAVTLLLISSGVGFFFYPLGGFIGERIGRRNVLIFTAGLTPIFALLFIYEIHNIPIASVIYFFLYQWTNGTWSGAGYAYWAESFPTRVRGTVDGFLTGWFNFSTFAGALMFTVLVTVISPFQLWMLMAVALSIGELFVIGARNIHPGSVLEDVAI